MTADTPTSPDTANMTVDELIAPLFESDNATLATVQPVLHIILIQAAEFYDHQGDHLTQDALEVAAFAVSGIDEDSAKQMLVSLEDLADEMIDASPTPELKRRV